MVLPGAPLPLTVGTEFTTGETDRHSKPRRQRYDLAALVRHKRSMDQIRMAATYLDYCVSQMPCTPLGRDHECQAREQARLVE